MVNTEARRHRRVFSKHPRTLGTPHSPLDTCPLPPDPRSRILHPAPCLLNMISRLKGAVLEASPLLVVLDVSGVGYEVHIPVTTAERIPSPGGSCELFIHAAYREDSQSLYGFATREERDFFRLLVDRVSGIGPKIGITILSRLSIDLLRSAISAGDVALLAKCPGIGKKTAERLVIELKDKVGATVTESATAPASGAMALPSSAVADAVASLVTLGYKPADADKMVAKARSKAGDDPDTETLVRLALA